ncbi:DUF397 domain-containing protein [Nocardiopsis trehalosi]|jgi:hypothetical protein|uniref:DUF397 domain-containing protein n=1 Tax=Nocardiopsis trehalosi TaxID=109329 RepID=UPI000A0399B6|nr:DUF397 domain-containing protein [Nocardiopsis trehalosi]
MNAGGFAWHKSSYSSGNGGNCVEVGWRKSSYSGGDANSCIEVADVLCACDATWHKSSHSGNQGGDCVEVAEGRRSVLVRDTQNRGLGHLGFPATEWASFLREVKNGGL